MEPGKILVVDDQEPLRIMLARLLAQHGHTVRQAGDGPDALALLRAEPFDLLLLDMMMPGMSGYEVLQWIKADPQTRDLPVVILSANVDVEDVIACIDAGAEDYLFKPFNTVLLHTRVNASLEKKRLRDSERSHRERLEAQVAERTALAEQRAADLAISEAALRQQTILLQSVLDSMGDGVVVVDTGGAIASANPAATTILGDPAAALAALRLPDQATLCPPQQNPLGMAVGGQAVDAAELFLPAAGRPGRWLSITARPLRGPAGQIAGGVAVVRDISAAKAAGAALLASEERYALAARGSNDGLWDWDLCSDQIFFSPRWKAMLGLADDAIGTAPDEWLARIHPDDREPFKVRLAAHFRHILSYFEQECRVMHEDGSYRWMLCRGMAVWDDGGAATRIAGSQTDITDRRAAEQQLMYDALHDLLTGLPNRALFLDRLDRMIAIGQRDPLRRFAVLFLDLDRFKTINDSLGHAVGDQLLTTIAQRIQGCLRPSDTVARLGGDEFTVLIEDIADDGAAILVADRIQQAIAEPVQLATHAVFTTASIGITLSELGYTRSADMIRDADTAMYHAKMGGKARHTVFAPAMHTQAMAKLQLEGDLREALVRGELRIHYQPIVSLINNRITGFESLVRWQHPQRGLLLPGSFLEIAEETGLIVPISWWVLRDSCRQMRRWQAQFVSDPPLSVNVNLSARLFSQPDVVDQIAAALAASGLDPASLKLEITEHSFIELSGATSEVLGRIRGLGVQLCIDDFGTGYSSLSYLHTFPVSVLKIDRSFIERLRAPDGQGEIVQTIIDLARTMGLDVVAEGIETDQQYQRLLQLDCAHGQGWLFAPALDEQGVQDLMLSRQEP